MIDPISIPDPDEVDVWASALACIQTNRMLPSLQRRNSSTLDVPHIPIFSLSHVKYACIETVDDDINRTIILAGRIPDNHDCHPAGEIQCEFEPRTLLLKVDKTISSIGVIAVSKTTIAPSSFRARRINEVDTGKALLCTYSRGLKYGDGKKGRREGDETRKHKEMLMFDAEYVSLMV